MGRDLQRADVKACLAQQRRRDGDTLQRVPSTCAVNHGAGMGGNGNDSLAVSEQRSSLAQGQNDRPDTHVEQFLDSRLTVLCNDEPRFVLVQEQNVQSRHQPLDSRLER